MGAQQSRTQLEAVEGGAEKRMVPLDDIAPVPRIQRAETFEEKLYRKCSAEPLVPIGCLVTAYFLGSGIKSFYNRDAGRSQKMMRLRVAAQFSTLLIFVGYAGSNAFTLNPRPNQYGKDEEEK